VNIPDDDELTVENHGSLILLRPNTEAMRAVLVRLTGPAATWFGGALVVEPRYVQAIVEAIARGEGRG
jgi:hypothetical protein